jgi:hypothetical protein
VTVMKKHPIGVCVVLGVSITFIVVACTITQKHGPGVSIHGTYVEVYPGTKISSDDQNALDAVLKNFNKSLYQIRTYDYGNLVKTRGSLEVARIDQKLVAEVGKASLEHISGSAMQFGIGNGEGSLTSPAKQVVPVPIPQKRRTLQYQPSPKELEDSARLVSRVRPILLKYSRDQVANIVNSGGR